MEKQFLELWKKKPSGKTQISCILLPKKNSMQTPANPFNRATSITNKIINRKANRLQSSYDQHSVKSTNSYASNILIPYDSDSSNEDRKSPSIKSKARPFKVTKSASNGDNSHCKDGDQRLTWYNSNVTNTVGHVPSLSAWNEGRWLLKDDVSIWFIVCDPTCPIYTHESVLSKPRLFKLRNF